jgi:hypothetical protein
MDLAPDGTRHGIRYLAPGTRVCLENGLNDAGADAPEYGVVVHCWRDESIDMYDCYVAFFGAGFPTGEPSEKPYILRYYTSTLRTVEKVS